MTEQTSPLHAALASARPQLPLHPRPIVSIGSGGIVRDAHMPAYRAAGFPVAVAVDQNSEKSQALAADFNIPCATTSIAEAVAFAPRDCIFDVAVPAGALLDVLPQLPDGAAVLLQKPMGNTLAEAEQILALCRSKGMTAAVNFQLRWAPVMIAARSLTTAGVLGELHDMEVKVSVRTPWELWSFLATAPRLEILYHSIHYVDLVRSWFGTPERVYAKTVRNPRTPALAPTKSVIIMDYGEWKRVFITTNHAHTFQGSQHSYVQWEGTTGAMKAVMGVNLDYPIGRPDTLTYAPLDSEWQTLPTTGNWFPEAFIGSMGSLQSFVTGETNDLPTSVEDAIQTMRVVEAAYLSSESGGAAI